jgi:lipopolysaccharide biosynthesis protein
MNFKTERPENALNFLVGTMFWSSMEALKTLFDLGLNWDDYPVEALPNDDTMLHAVERLMPKVVKACGFREAVTYMNGVFR